MLHTHLLSERNFLSQRYCTSSEVAFDFSPGLLYNRVKQLSVTFYHMTEKGGLKR